MITPRQICEEMGHIERDGLCTTCGIELPPGAANHDGSQAPPPK